MLVSPSTSSLLIASAFVVRQSLAGKPGAANPTALIDAVLDNYDKRVRPNAGSGQPVLVHMTIVLGILIELRENQQVASWVMSHVQRWNDPKLAWDPDEFGGLEQVVVPQSFVWVPKLFIYNSMDTKDMLGEDRYDVRIAHNGDVKVNIPQFVTCICRLNIALFPFDTQFCAIALASPLLNIHEMDVNVTRPPKDSYFAGNAEWEVMDISVRQMHFIEFGEYRAEVHYIVHLNRRPIYYITVIVVPTFLISALSILGIFSPGSNDGPRNEKVSLGLGSLLAMTVLLDIVAGAMPKSNSIPLLGEQTKYCDFSDSGFYIVAVILLCAIGVAMSMAFLWISRSFIQTERMPTPLAYSILRMQPLRKYIPQPQYNGSVRCMNFDGEKHIPKFPDLAAIYAQLTEVSRAQRAYREKLERVGWKTRVEREWNRVFARFDYLALFLFELLNLLVLLWFLRFAFLPVPSLPENFSV